MVSYRETSEAFSFFRKCPEEVNSKQIKEMGT
jgi:hypothetical protein